MENYATQDGAISFVNGPVAGAVAKTEASKTSTLPAMRVPKSRSGKLEAAMALASDSEWMTGNPEIGRIGEGLPFSTQNCEIDGLQDALAFNPLE